MTETNAERLKRIKGEASSWMGLIEVTEGEPDYQVAVKLDSYNWLIEQAERNLTLENSTKKAVEMQEYYLITNGDLQDENTEFKKLLEGNDGMSVKEIRAQFVDMHRDYLSDYSKLKREIERLRQALEESK